jgi:hypothetical protein
MRQVLLKLRMRQTDPSSYGGLAELGPYKHSLPAPEIMHSTLVYGTS